MNAAEIARHLYGTRAIRLSDGSYLVPCPAPGHGKGRGDRRPSLQISDGETALLVTCHAGCDRRDVLATLRARGLFGNLFDSAAAQPSRAAAGRKQQCRANNGQLWQQIWKDARHPRGSAVESYLAHRGLALPPDAGKSLRFHPRCPFGKDDGGRTIYTPGMIALVRNIMSNAPQAVHRTALELDGRKVTIDGRDRMALGPLAGGAVKLTADECVTHALGIGEGIETTLSLQRIPEWQGSPVWALINDNGVANFPALGGIETLAVAVDHDAAGEKAALAVAERWRAENREILLFEASRPDRDLNDVVNHHE